MTCPKCGSSEIRLSRHAHSMDALHRIGGDQPYRCRKCRHRFYSSEVLVVGDSESVRPAQGSRHTPGSSWLRSSRSRKRLKRGLIALTIFVAMFVIFWLFLRYLTTERAPGADSAAVPLLFGSPHAGSTLA